MNATLYIALFIIVSIIIFGMILTVVNRNRKKNERKKLTACFDDFVLNHQLTVDKKQVINNNMIGIDRLNSKLVFLETSEGQNKFHLLNLEDLSACKLVKQRNPVSGYISKIYLRCTFKNKTTEIILPFFDEIKDEVFKMLRSSRKAAYWERSVHIFREAAILLSQQQT